MRSAKDIAAKAAELVGGDRAHTHGDKGLNFRTSGVLHDALDKAEAGAVAAGREPLDPALKFALRMVLAKMSRVVSGAFNIDDFVDMAGYAACAGEVAGAVAPVLGLQKAGGGVMPASRGPGLHTHTSCRPYQTQHTPCLRCGLHVDDAHVACGQAPVCHRCREEGQRASAINT